MQQPDKLPNNNAAAEAAGNGGSRKDANIMAVRYGAMNWVGRFTHAPELALVGPENVVVQTDRGIELGQRLALVGECAQCVSQEQIKTYINNSGPEFYRQRCGRVLRKASPEDIDEQRHLNAHTLEDVATCAEMAKQHSLDMHVVTAEHLLGGERIIFYFCAETRVDFRALVKELAHRFQTRIEMRQVGARDEARLVADYEVCGRECCCRTFLKKLRPVGMKMAKLQKSTLDPSKVSGRCGRLRCCLRYEHTGYEELAKKLPRRGKPVETADGLGTVIDQQILTQLVMVRLEDGRQISYPVDEISALTPAELAERQAARAAEVAAAAEQRSSRGAGARSKAPPSKRPEPAPDAATPAPPPDKAAPVEVKTERPDEAAGKPAKRQRRRPRRPRSKSDTRQDRGTPRPDKRAAEDKPAPPAAPGTAATGEKPTADKSGGRTDSTARPAADRKRRRRRRSRSKRPKSGGDSPAAG